MVHFYLFLLNFVNFLRYYLVILTELMTHFGELMLVTCPCSCVGLKHTNVFISLDFAIFFEDDQDNE